MRSELGERQRGIQSILGTAVAFFTPKASRVKGQSRLNLDKRRNVPIVAMLFKLFKLQDVQLEEKEKI